MCCRHVYCTVYMYTVQLIYRRFRRSSCCNAFPMGQNNPQNCSFPHLTRGYLGPSEYTTQTASRLVQSFCMAHACVQQIDKHRRTHRQTTLQSTGLVNRPHLMLCIAMRPNNGSTRTCFLKTAKIIDISQVFVVKWACLLCLDMDSRPHFLDHRA